jgi:hypothetical protein
MSDNKPPEETFRIGSIKASVWLQEGQERPAFRSVSLARSYRDAQGQWQQSVTFTARDLPAAVKTLEMAMDYVLAREARGGTTEDATPF